MPHPFAFFAKGWARVEPKVSIGVNREDRGTTGSSKNSTALAVPLLLRREDEPSQLVFRSEYLY